MIVAPSMLACDFGRVAQEVRRVEAAGADWLHLDVMDGHFVDNISFGPAFVDAVAKAATVPLDIHLMIDRPDRYVPRFQRAAHNITVHVEAPHDVATTLAAIREAGCSCGLSLVPSTPFEVVVPFLDRIDLLLVMTVVPGFGGQAFMTETMPKVTAAAEARANLRLKYRIEVDGGINALTAATARKHGADTFVVGTAAFQAADIGAILTAVRGG